MARIRDRVQAAAGMNDPALLEFIRGGEGAAVSVESALENSAVWRCVDLISGSIGMLPLGLARRDAGGALVPAEEHALHQVLRHAPNGWQTPFEFKALMQTWALVHGNAYALPVRLLGRVTELRPIRPDLVEAELRGDWSVVYHVQGADGARTVVPAGEMFHLRGPSLDGVTGISRVKKAARVIATALRAQEAGDRLFREGIMASGALRHPNRLGPEAVEHLRRSMEERYAGAGNAGKWMILEEGMEAQIFQATAENSQLVETRAAQVEEIARIFGVPRPLMGVEETSWGSGIEQLAILFVRFGLAPWFKAWEEAITRSLLPRKDWGVIIPDFDERELLRGTLKDQAEFFARALGSGGHSPWMAVNEVRELSGLGRDKDGDGLKPANAGAARGASNDVPETTAAAARA
ncbi:MAG: phage portal protein [Amaricoccus sp.]